MKTTYFLRKAVSMLLLTTLILTLTSCGTTSNSQASTGDNSTKTSPSPMVTPKPDSTTQQPSPSPTPANKSVHIDSYETLTYADAPNKNSSVKIQYPNFSGDNIDTLNKLVYDKAQSLAQLDSTYTSDTGLTANYQSAVTLQNSKIVSIVFWGESGIVGGAFPYYHIYTLNIDLQTMKEVILKDLYVLNDDFQKVFFQKTFFPTDPITSGDESAFNDTLKVLTPEYDDSFKSSDKFSFYLKKDSIVISAPVDHASGDHFEAELKYGDIQQFYIAKQNYLENQ